jgi:hypothetical protein
MKKVVLFILSSIFLLIGCASQPSIWKEGGNRHTQTWKRVWNGAGIEKPFIVGDSVYIIGTSKDVWSTQSEARNAAAKKARVELVKVFQGPFSEKEREFKILNFSIPLDYEIQALPSGYYAKVLMVSTFHENPKQ